MSRSLILLLAVPALALASAAASQTAPPKPVSRADFISKIDASFNALDTNHDGFLSAAEVQAAQAKELQQLQAARTAKLQSEFKRLDTNHDGQLSYQEFAPIAGTVKSNETPQQALQKLDSNRDGKVSAAEFRASKLPLFEKLDLNHDGIVTVDEARKAASGQK